MRTETRRQLKHDKFAETMADKYSWAVEHRDKLTFGVIAVAVILAVMLGGLAYNSHRNTKAGNELGKAMDIYNAPLRPAGMPPQPEMLTFTSAEERARAAHPEFEKIANQYSHTDSGAVARYFAAITAGSLNDNALAEKEFKQAAGSGGKDLASLSKLALAGLYADTNRESEAIDIYKQLIDHPTNAVAKSTAQLKLAELYDTKQPDEAAKIYQQIQKESPESMAAEVAAKNLQSRSK